MMGWWFVSNLLTGKRPGILYRRSVPDDFAFSSFPLLKFSSPSFLLRMSSSFTTTASVSVYVLPLSLSPASTILSWKNEMRGQEKKSEGTLAGLVVPLRDPLFFFSLGKRMASGGINSAWKPKEVAQRAGFSGRSFTSFYQDRLYPFMEEKKNRKNREDSRLCDGFRADYWHWSIRRDWNEIGSIQRHQIFFSRSFYSKQQRRRPTANKKMIPPFLLRLNVCSSTAWFSRTFLLSSTLFILKRECRLGCFFFFHVCVHKHLLLFTRIYLPSIHGSSISRRKQREKEAVDAAKELSRD